MGLDRIIEKLHYERARLDQIIQSLLELQAVQVAKQAQVKKRRGRISMGDAERQQVAQRMKNYWADQHTKRAARGVHP
jgi:hypothetical protein